jgi:hypothetical protein
MKVSRTLAIAIVTIMFATVAAAQTEVVKPRASSGGNSDTEIRTIYQQDVGQGYTVSSLNSIALQNARARVGNFGQSSANPSSGLVQSRTPSLAPGRSAKPFSSVGSSPTVSPYLNLFREDFDGGGDFNYQTLVRPQFQQLATNQQFQRQNQEISQRVQAISAQGAFQNPAGSEQLYPTGHQTAFGYYGRYYPGMPQPRR